MIELTNPSQLIERNFEEFEGNILIANPPADQLAKLWEDQSRLDAWIINFDSCKYWPSGNFSAEPDDSNRYESIILFLPKAKERLNYYLAKLIPLLSETGEIYLVGENKGGIKSAEKQLKNIFSSIRKIDSARHCALLALSNSIQLPEFQIVETSETIADISLNLFSLPGVFSQKKIDRGTELLLQHLPKLNPRAVIDYGVGCGVISAWCKAKWPNAIVDGIEIDALALHSAKETLLRNDLGFDQLIANNHLSTHRKYDLIISNPPFHKGIKTQYDAAEQFLSIANQYLTDRGQLLIVANNFLKYEPILEARFREVNCLIQKDGFKVLQAFGKK